MFVEPTCCDWYNSTAREEKGFRATEENYVCDWHCLREHDRLSINLSIPSINRGERRCTIQNGYDLNDCMLVPS
jgi:hypothetical protein